MKNTLKLILTAALLVINACSFANKSTVGVAINSNPSGANVVVDGQNFGRTPAFIELNPGKNHQANISKNGYAPATIDMETWYSVRGGSGGDGGRCIADSAGILPYFIVLLFAPEKCASFKKSEYFVDLQMTKAPNRQINDRELNIQDNTQTQYRNSNYQNYYQQ
jgi:hypothetical protein